jgi:hypothetical protein
LVLLLLMVLVVFHPPLVKWAVAKYSPEYTGRQITLEHFRLNPFTGNMHIRGLHVLEAEGDTVFLHVDTIDVNTTLYKMLGGTYEVTSLRVARPFVRIVQHGEHFNFDDLMQRFASDSTPQPEPADTVPVHWALNRLVLADGQLLYQSDLLPFPIHVVQVDLSCPGLAWNRDRIDAQAALRLDNGTSLRTEVDYAQASGHYDIHARLDSATLKFAEPWVAPYLKISELSGLLQADVTVEGNANDALDVGISGEVHLSDAVMKDPEGTRLAGIGKLDLVVDSIDIKHERYRVRRLTVDQPYLLFELYDKDDNWTRLLAADTVASSLEAEEDLGYDPMNPFSMLTYYVKLVAENYDALDYRADSVALVNGALDFNDHTLQHTFRYRLTDLSVTTTNVDSRQDSITLVAHSKLNGTGTFDARVDMDPNSLRNLHFTYTIASLGMPDFGPYTQFFLAHPILSGTTLNTCRTTIIDNKLQSENHLFVADFQFGRKMDMKGAYQLPVRLAVALLKDKDGNITLDFPVEGDLDDPEYKVMPIVWQVLKNLVVKAVNAPYNLLARAFSADEEDLKSVRFLHLQEDLTAKQEKPLNTVARVAKSKPELKIALVQAGDRLGEMEEHALFLARKAFLADSTGKTMEGDKVAQEEAVAHIDIRSPGFTAWLEKVAGPSDRPVQTRCMAWAGEAALNAEVDRLYAARIALIQAYLLQEHSLTAEQVTVRNATPADKLAESGQPYFQLVFSTEE